MPVFDDDTLSYQVLKVSFNPRGAIEHVASAML
jgi:hypothetical protein